MKLLLDTHIWLWSLLEPERLGAEVRAALQADDTELMAVTHQHLGSADAG